ncbi:hypothetical protein SVIO_003380 [Streptomyces violaceusniger]|uniref:HTH araC/xylS-type domain-containing protein n=1 Tax=Streptomyces violaceusniger TaxID=68280 RepID=A0A4D4KL78_STRVO|nr:hypothetical protein SVIO_003380 [Streptomyces violaceusniger]
MKAVNDTLTAMCVESSGYAWVEARGAWGISFNLHTTWLVLIESGSCVQHGSSERLGPGDCFLVQPGARFEVADRPGRPLVNFEDLVVAEKPPAGEPVTRIAAARFSYRAEAAEPLLAALPPVARLRLDEAGGQALRSTFALLDLERDPSAIGAGQVTSHLADLLFVYALRAYALSESGRAHGWFAALADPGLAPALHALHADLAHPWTVEALARRAGMSRAAFASAFKRKTGRSPIDYVTYWRMYRAKALLRDTSLSLTKIAADVGYDTDATFSRAFRRHEGVAPGAWRRRSQPRTSHRPSDHRTISPSAIGRSSPDGEAGLIQQRMW